MNESEFKAKYFDIVEKIVKCAETSRREGLLALEEMLDEKKALQRDIFEYGMRLVVDGTDAAFIDKVLSNIINLETDNDEKTLKIIQKEAVLAIQDDINPRMLLVLLNSYVNISFEEMMERFGKD